MKKGLALVVLVVCAVIFFASCRQCNKGNAVETVTKDSTINAGLDAVNADIHKDSLNPFLFYKRAHIYEANGDLKNATTDMFIALTLDSVRPEFYLYAADLFKKTGETKRGLELMNKAIVTDSMNTGFYVKASELAYIDTTIPHNYRLALDYLNAAIDHNPQNADIYFYKGNVFKSIGDTAKAISSFQTATELNPKFYNAYVQLGLLLSKKKDKNAERYLDNAIKVSDKPEDALYAKANINKEEGLALQDANKDAQANDKFNEAIANFKKVVEVNHRNAEAYMGIAFSYYQIDSVEQAYKFYGLATQIAPTYAGAYFSKGLCAEDLGKKQEAIMLYQNCLDLDPKFTRAQEHLKKLQPQ
ncbi:MAG TPA: tetratricopeptide repeat protein [Chitinophagales bacterium]|nr:tetratricopeptide repeat protein [Chitinophagales bacterium]